MIPRGRDQELTESNPHTSVYRHHFDADISDFSMQLLGKDQDILQAVCYRRRIS
jgi:hypothetical protein